MLGQAAISLGIECVVFADQQDDATIGIMPALPLSAVGTTDVDVVTFEHELTPLALVETWERGPVPVRPSSSVLALADKARQRERFRSLGLPVPRFAAIDDPDAVGAFAAHAGWPVVVKLAAGGYDGRGVFVVDRKDDLAHLRGYPLVVEELLPIEREVAVVVARRPGGEAVVYPTVETVQRDGMCREVVAPAPVAAGLDEAAQKLGLRIAEAIDAIGVLAIELFVVGGEILINEIAPRVHNSGHFSIEGCETSQFENHLRAVLDLPLGPAHLRAPWSVMVNVTGSVAGDPRDRLPVGLAVGGAHIHLYGKTWRPGRKLGHVTATATSLAAARAQAHAAVNALGGESMDLDDGTGR